MNRRLNTKVIKARVAQISYSLDENNRDDILNFERLRKEGVKDFGGKCVDIKLTDYLTVHSVIAMEEISVVGPAYETQHYLTGESNHRSTVVSIKFILDAAKLAMPVEEKLITNDVLELPSSSVKVLK